MQSALALLVTRIAAADHAHDSIAPYDFAITANLFHGCLYLHFSLLNTNRRYLARNTMRALLKSYGVNSTVTLSPGRMRM